MTIFSNRKSENGLGGMLVDENIITAEQLENSLRLQKERGGKLSEILLEQKLVTPEELATMLSVQLNMPLIDLTRHPVQPEALHLIPESMARKHTVIPLDKVRDSLVVVMADPEDISTIEDIKAQAKMNVEVALGIRSDIERAIDLHYRSSSEIEEQVGQLASSVSYEVRDTPAPAAWTPVTHTLDLLIAQAVRDRASDVHLEPQENNLRIRYRIDGTLHNMFSLPLISNTQIVSRIKIMAGMNIAEQRRSQDGQFSMKLGGKDIDIRVATMETAHGERVTLRILDKSLSLFTLPETGLLPEVLEKYQTVLKSPFGLILVGGPTGSGKTTTLYASINQLDRNQLNIMTIEDPIEYRFTDINQTQVNTKAGITFASGLRSIMRHDPDVILVGEIRDKDTAMTAAQAALTGHLVLSSIHANDAVGVLFRLMDLGVEPYLISSTLIGVVAQRMVRRLCPHCNTTHELSEEEQSIYDEEKEQLLDAFHEAVGCNLCSHTGYQGRTGLFELMVMSDEIRKRLRGSINAPDIKTQALHEGMVTMKHDGMLKAKQGITSVSEVLRSVFSIG
ncbi:GspE/PulE family protein [Chloroflexota bacterium]